MAALARLRQRARELKVELIPVDLIPDTIPIVGFIDDLIFIPLAIALACFVARDRRRVARRRGAYRVVDRFLS